MLRCSDVVAAVRFARARAAAAAPVYRNETGNLGVFLCAETQHRYDGGLREGTQVHPLTAFVTATVIRDYFMAS